MKRGKIWVPNGWYDPRRKFLWRVRAAIGTPELHVAEAGAWDVDFPERLRQAILQRGGVDYVSKLTAIPVSQIRRYFNSETPPSLFNTMHIAISCDVSVDWLLNINHSRRVNGRWKRKLQRLSVAIKQDLKISNWRGEEVQAAVVAFGLVAVITFIWAPILLGGW